MHLPMIDQQLRAKLISCGWVTEFNANTLTNLVQKYYDEKMRKTTSVDSNKDLWAEMYEAAAEASDGCYDADGVDGHAMLTRLADYLVPYEAPPHGGMRPGGTDLTYQETLSVERQRLREILLAEAEKALTWKW